MSEALDKARDSIAHEAARLAGLIATDDARSTTVINSQDSLKRLVERAEGVKVCADVVATLMHGPQGGSMASNTHYVYDYNTMKREMPTGFSDRDHGAES
jgi:hypothetical protein